jgi:hypothetical protein
MKLHKFNSIIADLKLKFKKNKEKYIKVGTIVFCITCLIASIIFFAYAKFATLNKYNIIESAVGTFTEGDYILASYLDGTKVDTLPTKSDSISVDHIDCDNNATGTWNYTDWAIYITGATKRTKCTVYFVTQAHTGATEGDSKLGTASTDQVLSGATFSSATGTNITGTMANNGELNWAPTSSTTYTVPAGYYSGGTLDSSGAYNAGQSSARGSITRVSLGSGSLDIDSNTANGTSSSVTFSVTGYSGYTNFSNNNFGLVVNSINSSGSTGGSWASGTANVSMSYNSSSGVLTVTKSKTTDAVYRAIATVNFTAYLYYIP